MSKEETMKANPNGGERDRVIAHLNMFAVLPRLAELAEFDQEAKELVKGMEYSIRFRVLGGPTLLISISNGEIKTSATDSASADTGLMFTSYAQINKMFAGEKVVPLPYWGAWKLGDLKRFTRLTELLEKYLKADEEDLKDPVFAEQVVKMTLRVAVCAVPQLVAHDHKSIAWSASVPEGVAMFKVLPDGPATCISKISGTYKPILGDVKNPTVATEFKDLNVALAVLSGKMDAMAALGLGDIRISGLIPMADHLNSIIDRIGHFMQ